MFENYSPLARMHTGAHAHPGVGFTTCIRDKLALTSNARSLDYDGGTFCTRTHFVAKPAPDLLHPTVRATAPSWLAGENLRTCHETTEHHVEWNGLGHDELCSARSGHRDVVHGVG